MVEGRHRWIVAPRVVPSADLAAAAAAAGIGLIATGVLAGRGIASPSDLAAFLASPRDGLHDPRLLPDAGVLRDRIDAAAKAGETVMVFGDFDADGLTGLAIVVSALGRRGIRSIPYVPSRLEEGHGLSLAAVEAARAAGATVIVTVDTGSSSVDEIAAAQATGIDVIVTDHHRVPPEPPDATALVNPQRADGRYPDRRLSGSGVAFKVAQLLLADEPGGPDAALGLVDLAMIGTVSDVAPVVGENRAIARLGLELLRTAPRPGIAALLERVGVDRSAIDLETIGFSIAPRLNAAGRMGDAIVAAQLLLADDPAEAAELATHLETANDARRDLTRTVLAEARAAVVAGPSGPATIVHGPWPVGIIGLVAGRLADETGRPAIVGADLGDRIRASCRSGPGVDLGATLAACADLLIRHGGHAGAAGFEILGVDWDRFGERFSEAIGPATDPDPRTPLRIDVALPARSIDYTLVRDLDRLAPYGPGNPDPLVLVTGLTVSRVRAANGGHTQLVLRRDPDVLDGIAFARDDLPSILTEGERIDVVARLMSRTFGGFESLQLEVRDVATSGWFDVRSTDAPAAAVGAEPVAVGTKESRDPDVETTEVRR